MIAFLHTSKVHIERFEKLVKKYNKEIEIKHYVNEELLEYALLNGKVDSTLFNKEVNKIKENSPSLLICTCSTYGKECDKLSDVYRIDAPIVSFLVTKYEKIGLAYTANSTKEVSRDLILKIASGLNRKIDIINCDCSDFWKHFEEGDYLEYEKKIAEKVKLMESQIDVMFLSQASMEGAINHLSDFRKEILSSPEFGIKTLLNNR